MRFNLDLTLRKYNNDKNPTEDETISILEFIESEIYSTRNGNISVLSDGTEIKITQ